MKLDCILTACNLNQLYMDFIPLFIKTWNKLYPCVDVKIILVSTYIPHELKDYSSNIILFEPIKNVSTAFISQYIRILYPAILNYDNGIMITDIDILPMNNTYYTTNIEKYDNDKFINLRDAYLSDAEIATAVQMALCYNVATSKVWRDVFNITTLDDINKRLEERFKNINFVEGPGENGWFTDQLDLYKSVKIWDNVTHNFIYLKDRHTKFTRLDRGNMNERILDDTETNKIKNGYYCDYHCLRPYSQHKYMNELIYNTLQIT